MKRALIISVLCITLTRAIPLISFNEDSRENQDEKDSQENLDELDLQDIIDLSVYGSDLFAKPEKAQNVSLLGNENDADADVNPEELGNYVEGDMLVPRIGLTMKNGIVTRTSRWPKGIVPYEIDGGFNDNQLAIIHAAMDQYHQHTCIRFVPYTGQRDYVIITDEFTGCWSSVGRLLGVQLINLRPPCLRQIGTPIHELMHALGFLHEQNRKERDDYISIQYENIRVGTEKNFRKVPRTEAFDVPYDYSSVMHYSSRAFSSNQQPTILAKQEEDNAKMGQRRGFSAYDIEKVNRMYNCQRIPETSPSSTEQSVTSTEVKTGISASTTLTPSDNNDIDNLLTDLTNN